MPEGWVRAGYKKKSKCERCGIPLYDPGVCEVHYVNGDITDNHFFNLRTICIICDYYIKHNIKKFNPDDLTPDF